MKKREIWLLMVILLCAVSGLQQSKAETSPARPKGTVSGYVSNAETGEIRIGATIASVKADSGVLTNDYGYFALCLTPI